MTLDKALTYAGAFVLALLVMLAGIFVIVPQVSATRAAHAETRTIDAANDDTSAQIESRVLDLYDLDSLRNSLLKTQVAVPTTVDASSFISQLAASATELGVTVDEITLGDPQTPATTVDPEAAAAAASATEATGTTATTDTTAAATAAPESFLVVPVSLSIGGSYDAVLNFIDGLRQGDRLVSITAFETAFSGEADAAAVTGTITALIYVLPTDAATD